MGWVFSFFSSPWGAEWHSDAADQAVAAGEQGPGLLSVFTLAVTPREGERGGEGTSLVGHRGLNSFVTWGARLRAVLDRTSSTGSTYLIIIGANPTI